MMPLDVEYLRCWLPLQRASGKSARYLRQGANVVADAIPVTSASYDSPVVGDSKVSEWSSDAAAGEALTRYLAFRQHAQFEISRWSLGLSQWRQRVLREAAIVSRSRRRAAVCRHIAKLAAALLLLVTLVGALVLGSSGAATSRVDTSERMRMNRTDAPARLADTNGPMRAAANRAPNLTMTSAPWSDVSKQESFVDVGTMEGTPPTADHPAVMSVEVTGGFLDAPRRRLALLDANFDELVGAALCPNRLQLLSFDNDMDAYSEPGLTPDATSDTNGSAAVRVNVPSSQSTMPDDSGKPVDGVTSTKHEHNNEREHGRPS